MRVKVISDTDKDYFERKVNDYLAMVRNKNGFANVEIEYSTCTHNDCDVTHSAMIIVY